jgi:hypothetical protein
LLLGALDGEFTIKSSMIVASSSNTVVRKSTQHFKVDGLRPFMAARAIDGELTIEITVILDSCSNTAVRNLPQHFKRQAMGAGTVRWRINNKKLL